MNKRLSKIVSLVTAAAVTIFVSSGNLQTIVNEIHANAAETEVTYGDVNNDGKVDAFDLTLIKQEIIDSSTTPIDLAAADVNIDGVVDVKDAIEVQDFLLGRTKGFTGSVKKAFSEIDRTFVTKNVNGDLISGDETQLTNDMAALADLLSSPAEIYKYLLNNFKTEFYYGSRKGAVGTYEECGGNDYDQASLMISMLRYLGYNAQYAIAEVVFTDDDLINMTAASDIESAKKIFTAHGKNLTPYESGGYLTEQAMVRLLLEDDDQVFLDPSFKYYAKKTDAANLEGIMDTLEAQYDLSDPSLNLYSVSNSIENVYNAEDTMTAFQQYEIVQQDIDNTLSYEVPSGKVELYNTTLPQSKSDMVAISIGDTKVYQKKSCFLYGKDITLEYEFTEEAAMEMDAYFGYDSIDDLTENIGTYKNRAQIHGVLKVDGNSVAYNGDSYLLGEKEMLQIDITTAGETTTFEKELTVGALYSLVFDYQIISPYEIADEYSKLPQTSQEQNSMNESNIFGSRNMMNTLTLLGKTYFSQVDTNNAELAYFSNMRYERGLSVAVVEFTPNIYNQNGSSPRMEKEGKIGIDVLGNWTIFNSLDGDSEEEAKIRHSSGYLSSFYESETIKQFTGMQTVSTAEVLNEAAKNGVDILYLSKANVGELEASGLSAQNKADITQLINDGNYITVPSEEISIGSWTGTGYIVYDPATDTNTYIINTNLHGGGLVSWVGLAFLCDIIASIVECTWAFDLIMLGASILGTGLILLTGGLILPGLLIAAIGLGAIVAGGFYLKSIGDRLYESTELMDLYLDGDEEAGKAMMKKGYTHLGITLAFEGAAKLAKPISSAFANSKIGTRLSSLKPVVKAKELGQSILGSWGRTIVTGFANSPYGVAGALEIMIRISPKYIGPLCELMAKSGNQLAENYSIIFKNKGIEGVEATIEETKKEAERAAENGLSAENIKQIEVKISDAVANNSKFTEPTLEAGGTPKGSYESASAKDSLEKQRSIKAQNDAADYLASKGYDLEMLPNNRTGNGYGVKDTSSPDYLIDNEPFDCYSPGTAKPHNVGSNIREKTEEQATRVVLNLQDYEGGTVDEVVTDILGRLDTDMTHLEELIIVNPKEDKIIRIIR